MSDSGSQVPSSERPTPAELPHGAWPSPISANLLAASGVAVGWPTAGQGSLWWSEVRPSEGGRSVPVCLSAQPSETVDALPAPWSARTRVHEYGGGAWWLGPDDLFFAEWSDQRLYRMPLTAGLPKPGTDPQPVTPEPATPAGWRYADGRQHPTEGWLVAVREDHTGRGEGGQPPEAEAANELVAIALDDPSANPTVLATGADFVAAPRFSSDGRWLSWVEWDHPSMPWDNTRLCAAPVFANRRIGNPQVVAGADSKPESIVGPDWTSDGRLVFSSDRNGWWNLYSWRPEGGPIEPLTALDDAEIGGPAWVFDLARWVELTDGRLVVAVTRQAVDHLAVINPSSEPGGPPTQPVPVPVAELVEIIGLAATDDGRVMVAGAGPRSLPSIRSIDVDVSQSNPDDGMAALSVRPSDDPMIDPGWFSEAQAITFPSGEPTDPTAPDRRQAHAFFYPPTGVDVVGPARSLPPLIVMGHGGPTAHSDPALSLKVQYWTSRGFAVVDVNYGGSTGFGRAYRQLLQGTWGIVDVEDCINAALTLADRGLVDGERLAIRGGSAGGFTVLAALERSDRFAAGTNLFGVADLTALAADTHKFESRYLDGLIGPFPEAEALYRERSPINHTELLSSPLLVLQGLEDEIVPPNQSEAIVAAVADKGLPHAYVTFEGEQHGFRQATNIVRSFEVELWFYGRVFGFEPADSIVPPTGAVGL